MRRLAHPGLRLAIILALISLPIAALAHAAGPQRVAILPFTANAKEDISFLVKGVRDMLATRLAWKDKVTVIEPEVVARVMKEVPPPYTDQKARELGRRLQADAVVYGSITMLGKAVSVDARLVRVNSEAPALTAFVQASDLGQVIPQINTFAQRINAEIFKRPEALAASKPQKKPDKGKTTAEGPLAGLPENISPLNPLFMRSLSGIESDRYWRSPRIPGNITSLAVADIDLDGKNEILALLEHGLRVYRLAGRHFALVYELKNGPTGEYLFVDAADVDGDGRPEIFVSNLNNYTIQSFVLVWDPAGGLRYVAKDLPWYFRVQPNPTGKGKILLGQAKDAVEPFIGPIYEMKYHDGAYVPSKAIAKPDDYANIYNMLLADLNGSGRVMTLMIGPSYDLRVYSSKGERLWQSGEVYCASSKFIRQPPATNVEDPGWEDSWYFVPTRMVLTDLDHDGRPEVIVVRNRDRMHGFLEKMRLYYQGVIYSLYWNGMALAEDWRTPRISGYVTDYTIADVGNVGKPALVLAVGQRQMKGWFSRNVGHIVAFTLKPRKKKKRVYKKGL